MLLKPAKLLFAVVSLLFCILLFPLKNYSQTYNPIAVTGFDADGIAETPSNAIITTTASMDNSVSAMYSQTFAAGAGIAGGIINSGTIVNGLRTYQLQPFNAMNVLFDTNGTTKIMTISTPAQFTKISVLGFSTEGASTVTIVLHFTDGTLVNAGSFNILDWFTGTGNVYNGYGKCPRIANVTTTIGPPNNPNFYPIDINIPCADQQKNLDKVTFINTGGQFGYTKACFLALSAVPYSLTITPTITNDLCFGANTGSVSLAVVGNSGPYTYSWTTIPVQTTDPAINLTAGTYTCTITDANGCTATVSETVTQPLTAVTAVISNQVNANCGALGSATVTGAGGTGNLTYSWNTIPVQTTTTAINLTGGTYTVTVTDANGCTATASVTITQSNAITAVISAQTNVLCFGGNTGSATVTPNGGNGYTYNWNTIPVQTTQTANNLSVGSYYVTVTDNNGCTVVDSVTITQPASAVTVTITNQVNATCNNLGSATANGAGGTGNLIYSWNTLPVQTTATAINLGAGTFIVTVTDANGCTAIDSVTIIQTNGITASITAQTNVLCFGGNTGTATVTPVGGNGYSYSWNTIPIQTTQTAINLTSGVYSVTVTSGNGCTAVATVTITQPASALTASITSQTNLLCNGGSTGSATAQGAGGTANYTYLWSDAQNVQTAINLAAGNYIVTVTDANGCTTTTNVTITQPNALTATITSQTNVSACNGNNGSATVTGAGGTGALTYSWNTIPIQTTATANNLVGGTYIVTVTDANGCTATTTVIITQPSAMILTVSANVSICTGESTTLSVSVSGGSSPYTYIWNPGGPGGNSIIVSPLATTSYTVSVTDASGCNIVSPVITVTVGTAPNSLFTASNLNGCAPLTVDFTDQSTVGVGTITSWLWSFGDNNSSSLQNPSDTYAAGTYSVSLTVTSSTGCSATMTVHNMIDVYPDPVADFTASTYRTIVVSSTITFYDHSSNANSWTWNFGDGTSISTSSEKNPTYTYLTPGVYTVTEWVTNSFGCIDSTQRTIYIDADFEFYVPNAFTPTNDGKNDIFTGVGNNIQTYQMQIFDRWGENIFVSNDVSLGWNGRVNGTGEILKQDVYIYYIRVTDTFGVEHKYDGKVSLIR